MGTRTGIYGWAFYFGNFTEPIDTTPWPNVCIRCGSGMSVELLAHQRGMVQSYRFFQDLQLPRLRSNELILRFEYLIGSNPGAIFAGEVCEALGSPVRMIDGLLHVDHEQGRVH